MGIFLLLLTCVLTLLILGYFATLDISNYTLIRRAILSTAKAAGVAFLVGCLALFGAHYLTPYLNLAAGNFLLLAQLAGPLTFVVLFIFLNIGLFKR